MFKVKSVECDPLKHDQLCVYHSFGREFEVLLWDFVLHEGFIFLLSCDDLLDLRYTFRSLKSGLKYCESVHRTARPSLVADKYQVSAKKRTPATNSLL